MSETCAPARVPTVGVEAVLAAGGARIVDLRTPAEFAEDHLPGAVNVPLFGDVERAILGTLYRCSPDEAFAEGRRRARDRIEGLVAEVAALAGWEPTGVDLPARLDAFTDGGLGVAFIAPFDDARHFFPWRPLRVSPIGAAGFFSERGLETMISEIKWVWIPSLLCIAAIQALRRFTHAKAPSSHTGAKVDSER